MTDQRTIRPAGQPTLIRTFGCSDDILVQNSPVSPLAVMQTSPSNACAQLAIGIALVTNLGGDATIPKAGQPLNTVYRQLHSVIDLKEIEQRESPILRYTSSIHSHSLDDEILVPRMVSELPIRVKVEVVEAPAFPPIEDDD